MLCDDMLHIIFLVHIQGILDSIKIGWKSLNSPEVPNVILFPWPLKNSKLIESIIPVFLEEIRRNSLIPGENRDCCGLLNIRNL